MEKTFVMIKPDGVEKDVTGEIISRFERAGLTIEEQKRLKLSHSKAEELYAVHKGRPFYGDLLKYVTSGEVVLMVVEGPDAVNRVRDIMGATNPQEARPGTIRADFAESIEHNVIHGSDSKENAQKEISIFFS